MSVILHHIMMGIHSEEPTPSVPNYLCFTAAASGTFTLSVPATVTSSYMSYVEYSLDGSTWTRLTVDSTAQSITTPTVAAGGKVYWRGSGTKMSTSTSNYSVFSATANFSVSGNIMSLLYADNFENQTSLSATYTFCGLFRGNTKLTSSVGLELPATTLTNYCYAYMFYGCSYMTETMSILPVTNLITRCYSSMYQSCSRLLVAPVLPALVLATSCYNYMFYGCSKLSYVKAMFTTMLSGACNSWLSRVSSTGTFVKNVNATWTDTGDSGVPTNWTVITEAA